MMAPFSCILITFKVDRNHLKPTFEKVVDLPEEPDGLLEEKRYGERMVSKVQLKNL